MRLSERERSIIRSAVTRHFGDHARVWLFGSRANDSLRGGDIDLLVETTLTSRDALRAKIATITDIQLQLGDQKIDLVTCAPSNTHPAEAEPLIVRNARREGIAL